MHNSIIFSNYIDLCKHHHNLFSDDFILHEVSPVYLLLTPFTSSHKCPLIFLSLYFCPFWTFHLKESYNRWSLVIWCLSLNTMFSRFVHNVVYAHHLINVSFNWLIISHCKNIPHFVCLFHSLVGEHLGWLQFLAILNNAATNIHVQVFVWTGHIFTYLG